MILIMKMRMMINSKKKNKMMEQNPKMRMKVQEKTMDYFLCKLLIPEVISLYQKGRKKVFLMSIQNIFQKLKVLKL